jgi:hypothetical protein
MAPGGTAWRCGAPEEGGAGVRPRGAVLGLGRGRRRRSVGGARLGHAVSRLRLK